MGMSASQKPQHTRPKNSKNGQTKTVQPPPPWLYLAITWPKIIPKKCYRTEILATSARVIWPRAVALPDGFTIPWLPSCTADVFLHHEQTAGK
jgi:hypothetical protein